MNRHIGACGARADRPLVHGHGAGSPHAVNASVRRSRRHVHAVKLERAAGSRINAYDGNRRRTGGDIDAGKRKLALTRMRHGGARKAARAHAAARGAGEHRQAARPRDRKRANRMAIQIKFVRRALIRGGKRDVLSVRQQTHRRPIRRARNRIGHASASGRCAISRNDLGRCAGNIQFEREFAGSIDDNLARRLRSVRVGQHLRDDRARRSVHAIGNVTDDRAVGIRHALHVAHQHARRLAREAGGEHERIFHLGRQRRADAGSVFAVRHGQGTVQGDPAGRRRPNASGHLAGARHQLGLRRGIAAGDAQVLPLHRRGITARGRHVERAAQHVHLAFRQRIQAVSVRARRVRPRLALAQLGGGRAAHAHRAIAHRGLRDARTQVDAARAILQAAAVIDVGLRLIRLIDEDGAAGQRGRPHGGVHRRSPQVGKGERIIARAHAHANALDRKVALFRFDQVGQRAARLHQLRLVVAAASTHDAHRLRTGDGDGRSREDILERKG